MTTAELAAKLARLRVLNGNLPPSTPASPAEIAELEAALGVALPTSYREFIAQVGTGAGPGHGLLSVPEMLSGDHAADDLPLTVLTVDGSFVPDSLVIASFGGDEAKLVTTGHLAGTVWESGQGYWTPVASTFGDWYDAWLTTELG